MIVTLSGVTYQAAVAGSGVPEEEDWPKPKVQRKGRGHRYIYEDVSFEVAELIVSHLEMLASSGWDDLEGSRDGRAMMLDAERIRVQMSNQAED